MYRLSLEECRYFRAMDYGTLYNIRHRCNHRTFHKVKSQDLYLTDERPEIFVCNKCRIGWHIHHKPPLRGNGDLERFLQDCTHTQVRTSEASINHNECLECGRLIEKHELAKLWKGIRNTTNRVQNMIVQNTQNHTDKEKIDSGKDICFVWDPEVYGERKWGVEYMN
jgi:hypothetical protein